MAPRGQALPQAATESAREARKAFFCELCQKGYARMNDFEAHEGSYDHQHRKRLKEMKQLTKDPNAASKAREAERNESGLKSINVSLSGAASGSGASTKKKPVFKSTLQPHNAAVVGQPAAAVTAGGSGGDVEMEDGGADLARRYAADPAQMKANGWEYERYDPRFPSGDCALCRGRCTGRCNKAGFDPRETYEEWCRRKGPELEALAQRSEAIGSQR